jgi:hypothetical protein
MSIQDMKALVEAQLDGAERYVEQKGGDSRLMRASQSGTVLQLVTVAIVAVLGILIFSQVKNSLPQPQDAALQEATGNVTSGFGDAMNLLPVVFVVLVASLVLAVVQNFRG